MASVLLASCASQQKFVVPPAHVGADTVPPAAAEPDDAPETGVNPAAGGGTKPQVERLTAPPRTTVTMASQDWSNRFPNDDQVTLAANAMPLRDFLQYAFGEVLKVGYVVAPGTPGLEGPITLNVQRPVSSRALYRLVVDMLQAQKIGVSYRDGVYYLAAQEGQGRIPIGFGRRAQDVPDVAGKVLQVIPLLYGVNTSIERTIRGLVNVEIQPDPQQSAIFVTGERDAILRVLDVVGLLDQPSNRARQVSLVSLSFAGPRELADQMVTLLGNEGIQTGIGRADGMNVALVPLEQLGALVIFASSGELLARAEYWARQIDRPSQGPEERYFVYHPRNARAADLADSLAPLLGGEPVARAGSQARDTQSAFGQPRAAEAEGASARSATQGSGMGAGQVTNQNALRRDGAAGSAGGAQPMAIRSPGLTLAVDPRSNTLIFYTTGLRYQSLLPMVRRLDVPPKQILLEATIAEVTLTGEFEYGVEFAFTEGKWSGGTAGGLTLPSGGMTLNWIGSVTDRVRARLLQTNSAVNILSNPTLVVRDGVAARIQVGNDVPTVGATASDPIVSDRVVTSVLYRRTGLNLSVRPTINAQGLVVLEINQSISNQVEGSSQVQGAPTFFERAVNTEVVARSGQSVLLAGLISTNKNDTSSRVPGLADVPGIGWLFESRSKSNEKTELVILLTPRIIENTDEWDSIRSGMQGALENLQLPPVAPQPPAVGSVPPAAAAAPDSPPR